MEQAEAGRGQKAEGGLEARGRGKAQGYVSAFPSYSHGTT